MLDRTNFLKKELRRTERAGLRSLDIVNFFWRQWKLISGITLVFLLVGAVIISRQTPVYTSTTQVLLEPHKDKTGKPEANQPDTNLDMAAIESQLSIVRSSV